MASVLTNAHFHPFSFEVLDCLWGSIQLYKVHQWQSSTHVQCTQRWNGEEAVGDGMSAQNGNSPPARMQPVVRTVRKGSGPYCTHGQWSVLYTYLARGSRKLRCLKYRNTLQSMLLLHLPSLLPCHRRCHRRGCCHRQVHRNLTVLSARV